MTRGDDGAEAISTTCDYALEHIRSALQGFLGVRKCKLG